MLDWRSLGGTRCIPANCILWDDFRNGFSVTYDPTKDKNSKWYFFSAPGVCLSNRGVNFFGDDGIATTSSKGLSIIPSWRNQCTNEPAFKSTVAPDSQNPLFFFGSGSIDHVKWLTYANHTASSGFPGFDLRPGHTLCFTMRISGRTFGTEVASEIFGDAVRDPKDDIRVASFAFATADFETCAVADFFLTDKTIYLFHERLTECRATLGNYAAFSYSIPVASRKRDDFNTLSIAYTRDRHDGRVTIRWFVDGHQAKYNGVPIVARPGLKLGSQFDPFLILDEGGTQTEVKTRQWVPGAGTFTLLDATQPEFTPGGPIQGTTGLVRLSDSNGFYCLPYCEPPLDCFQQLPPGTCNFVYPISTENVRLFGQGARLDIESLFVCTTANPA